MKDFCKKLGSIILIGGILGSLLVAFYAGKTEVMGYYSVSYERNWTLTFTYLISGIIGSVLQGTIFLALSEILERLEAQAVDNETIVNDVSLKNKEIAYREPSSSEWKCSGCGKINQNYTGTCACGTDKDK